MNLDELDLEYERLRKELISEIGYQSWYDLLEYEDMFNQKFILDKNYIEEINEILYAYDNAPNIYHDLMIVRAAKYVNLNKLKIGEIDDK